MAVRLNNAGERVFNHPTGLGNNIFGRTYDPYSPGINLSNSVSNPGGFLGNHPPRLTPYSVLPGPRPGAVGNRNIGGIHQRQPHYTLTSASPFNNLKRQITFNSVAGNPGVLLPFVSASPANNLAYDTTFHSLEGSPYLSPYMAGFYGNIADPRLGYPGIYGVPDNAYTNYPLAFTGSYPNTLTGGYPNTLAGGYPNAPYYNAGLGAHALQQYPGYPPTAPQCANSLFCRYANNNPNDCRSCVSGNRSPSMCANQICGPHVL